MTLRTTPIQARSAARVTELLDACAEVIDEVGIEHVTTNLVADRAGCSIGTIYRYFPDRIAVLRALGLRQCGEIRKKAMELLEGRGREAADYERFLHGLQAMFLEWHGGASGAAALGYAHLLDTPVTKDEAAMLGGALEAGETPRTQVSAEVAAEFLPEGRPREQLARDLDYVTLIGFALVDRAAAYRASGLDAGPELAWAERCLAVTIALMRERFEQLKNDELPASMGTLIPLS